MLDVFNHIPVDFVEECAPNYKSEDAVKRAFDEYLDDCEGPVTVAGLRFWPSDILKNCDPIAYNEEFCTYTDISQQLWIDTPDGWLTADDVDNIVDAWEMLTDEQQNEYLGEEDCDCGGHLSPNGDCDCEEV
jgi:hypothetical protein